MSRPAIAVALSGGIDSLAAAFLLTQQYRHVFGIHFTTGYEASAIDIKSLENRLKIDVVRVDLSQTFENSVIQYFLESYLAGKTPNPCLICNSTIKFGALLEKARQLGADYLATGHYSGVCNALSCPDEPPDLAHILRGQDVRKDQSYFLSMLSSKQAEHIIFPLAGMTKDAVKSYASANDLKPLTPKESQDICFIHDTTFAEFILNKKQLQPEPGDILDLDGKVVGRHQGLHRFTIGQRKGINCPAAEPYYVKAIDMTKNRLLVCFKKDLARQEFDIAGVNWNAQTKPVWPDIFTKIRYSHKGAQAQLRLSGDTGHVVFNTAQQAITPGQAAAFYDGDRVLGAGIIQ